MVDRLLILECGDLSPLWISNRPALPKPPLPESRLEKESGDKSPHSKTGNRFAAVSALVVAAVLNLLVSPAIAWENGGETPKTFEKNQLVAWCIVPFDAKNRDPAQRAEMVKKLGLRRVAYDWRKEHVATFEEEILQYKKHGIEYFAFWNWHDAIEPLIQKHGIQPQIWKTCPSPAVKSQQEKVVAAAEAMMPAVRKTKQLGLKLGLYNHGGWGGEPANLVKVCQYLREHHGADHVGIVYNFHHGHPHIDTFAQALRAMKPYLLCVNLNGMADPAAVGRDAGKHKILPIGSGVHERQMIRTLIDSGYHGPIGILGHRKEIDVEIALRQNLDGLSGLLESK